MILQNKRKSDNKKQKILFLIGNYGVGGKERQLTELIKSLPKKKYDIYLFAKSTDSFLFQEIKIILNDYISLNKNSIAIKDIFSLKRFLDLIKPDIVYSFAKTTSNLAFTINAFKLNRFKLINSSIRGAAVDFNFHLKLERFLYNYYDIVVSNSKAGLISYKQFGKKGRHVLYNGFNQNRIPIKSKSYLRQLLSIDDKFTVLMIGSMTDSKDQSTLIKAAKILAHQNLDIQFILLGDGPKLKKYLSIISSLGLNKFITLTGQVNNSEEYIKASDLSVLMSSSSEGFPNAVLESLGCGVPVIANACGGTHELLINDENGYFIKIGDHQLLAKKILFLYNNHNVLKTLGKNGASMVKEQFSMKNTITSFKRIINN